MEIARIATKINGLIFGGALDLWSGQELCQATRTTFARTRSTDLGYHRFSVYAACSFKKFHPLEIQVV
jgi:hypothetical protein